MLLYDTTTREAKPGLRPYRLYDFQGLYLEIDPSGGKWWRFKYRFNSREKRISLGVYPAISLEYARTLRNQARALVAKGIDPSAERKAQKLQKQQLAANSFEAVANDWISQHSPTWDSEYERGIRSRFEEYVFPRIGAMPISSITPPHLLGMLRRIEKRGILDTAHRVLGWCGQVFRYAVAVGKCSVDITTSLRDALAPAIHKHLAAITEPDQLGELLNLIDGFDGPTVVYAALQLAPLVFVRPNELCSMQWSDINLTKAQWLLVPSKQRTNKPKIDIIVPLSQQALRILRDLKKRAPESPYVFPNPADPGASLDTNAILNALRSIGVGKEVMCGHGFRATARTILDERLHERVDIIEHQLNHTVKDPNGRAYNRTSFLKQRTRMMQRWADYLDRLRRQWKRSSKR